MDIANTCLSLFFAISMHIGLEDKYNNLHPHVKCQQDSLISGLYYNSEEKVSGYIGLEYIGFEIGFATGYTYHDVVPMLRYKKDNWFIAPALEINGTKGFVIGLELQLLQ